ncbi:hypothetical protein BACPLE_00620 [Phocaeicola plebeius DSM 17135]|uniref:Uncharacterized protein n=1 Tax=Phocaeicola plebeius (strain DSM 17135 / JCM 12973 / CCUG 54634 / M2) TaxID=484018 RepID=B5CV91_PHOPM|nr:hypothetical protein BACPLE_00620 [Phocaeicola plebeius DSM 17135]
MVRLSLYKESDFRGINVVFSVKMLKNYYLCHILFTKVRYE